MNKLKAKVNNLYPQAHACMLAIGLLACVIDQHSKNNSATMAGVKSKERRNPIHQRDDLNHPSTSQSVIMTADQRLKSPEALN
jgi:hypothetical protein